MTAEDTEKIGMLIKKYPEPENFGSDLKAIPTWIHYQVLKKILMKRHQRIAPLLSDELRG